MILSWVGAVLLGILAPVAALSQPVRTDDAFISATVCAECHHETYDSWSRTFHALAVIDPVFTEAVERAEIRHDAEARALCLMCHSPTAAASGDFSLKNPVSREGVTCSFCHSVVAIDHDRSTARFTNDPGRLHINAGDHISDHHFENHQVILGSEFCAGCHEWTNALGLKVLSTWSEWSESFYSGEKITCQQCHMPTSLGSEATAAGSKSLRSTNLHFQMGGHSQDQLVAAARMEAVPEVTEGEIAVEVAVTNFKAGHKLPTGLPTRKMKLTVDLFDREGELLESRSAVYSRVIVDGEGTVLEDVTDQFLRGVRELDDTRIAPKETRRERFVFPRPSGEDFALLEVSLEYEIRTPYMKPPVLSFDVLRKRIPLVLTPPGEQSGSSPALSLVIIGVLFLVVTAVMVALMRRRNGDGPGPDRKE